ncbi:hypothetical protein BJY52DRAFT_1107499, partial [Lactarius psammicola]
VSPTQTMLIVGAGPMQFNFTFLNPIEPGDWVKQLILLSYMSLTVKSLDGAAHAVQVYSDLSAGGQALWWMVTDYGNISGFMVKRQNPTLPDHNHPDFYTEWGTLYHFMETGDNTTWTMAKNSVSRQSFQYNGVLDRSFDPSGSGGVLTTPNLTVFALSRDLGTIQAMQDPIVWAVRYSTNPVINYTDPSGTPQQRSLFYKTQYSDDESLVSDFINDFVTASSRAQKLDQKILQEAAPISEPLKDVVSLMTAHVYGSTQLMVAIDTSGEFNKSDVMAFMKDMKTNQVNPIEKLYSAFPAFMYIDPNLGRLLLEPLFQLQ